MLLNISNDAIFIADSHYNNQRIAFELFLDTILTKQISTSQLFLMGDMFDFLTYEVDYFKNINQDVIDKLNILSKQIEIIYLEGNHDFSIDKLFPNIIVIPRDIQPLIAQYKDKKIAISHGDIFTPTLYNIFTFILRNDTLLRFLNFLDKNDTTSKWIENALIGKKICHDMEDFDKFAKNRLNLYNKYDVDIVIEGHFHQGKRYKNYINIPSYACDEIYFKNNVSLNLL